MSIGLILDGVLMVLLIGALIIGFRVQSRLVEVRKAQTELADLVGQLDRATEKASRSVQELRSVGEEGRQLLASEIKRAKAQADELGLIVEAGDNLAGRLEVRLSQAATNTKRFADREASGWGKEANADDKPDRAPTVERETETPEGSPKELILAALREAR